MNDDCSFDSLRNLSIGTVQSVSPREWRVMLDHDAPHSTAINTGTPTLFPKINGYVLIPNESGALIGLISWIGIENAQYPKRQGFKDFDLIDLPFPQRIMSITPLGELRQQNGKYFVERGVFNYPSVGDIVILPKREQLQSIVENKDSEACFQIGVAPAAANAPVFVNPNKLFGRHLAILGNTGSGKSTSVAGIIRWSIEHAKKSKNKERLNARFIILDPNGEYKNSFDNVAKVRKFRIKLTTETDGFENLHVPAWLWNSYEWSSITDASGKTQRPILRQALREIKAGSEYSPQIEKLGRYYSSCQIGINSDLIGGPSNFKGEGKTKFGNTLASICNDLEKDIESTTGDLQQNLKLLLAEIKTIESLKREEFEKHGKLIVYYKDFERDNLEKIVAEFQKFLDSIGWVPLPIGPDEDSPIPYSIDNLPNHIERLSQERNVQQYLDFLIMRIRTMLSDTRMSSIIGSSGSETLEQWLDDYIGNNNAENGEFTIIDLSLVPSDVIHLVVAVISRMIFEALQRYRRLSGKELPTVMVLDEAHVFIQKFSSLKSDFTPQDLCNETFERIAREGRKFGLGLLISSQRPSELSPTVLSQCNTFLLHRIVNDKDQELVNKFVPDNLGSLLRELPILPTKKAILLGWASPIPILVEINELEEIYRPKSADPLFWEVWIGDQSREVSWKTIADEWQKKGEKTRT